VLAEQPADPRRPDDADAPEAPVQGPAVLLAQVADHQDRAPGLGGEAHERHERPPHRLVAGGRRVLAQERRERVDDHELRPVGHDRGPERVRVARQDERAVELPQGDAAEVGPGGLQARPRDLLGRVLAVDEDGVDGVAGQFAARQAGGQVAGEGGLAGAGVAVEDDEDALGEPAGPEPLHGLRPDRGREDDVRHGGSGLGENKTEGIGLTPSPPLRRRGLG
jgi:hypothetical protein